MIRHTRTFALLAALSLAGAILQAADAPPAKPGEKQAAIEAAKKAADWLLKQANDDGTFGKIPPPTRKMPGFVGLVLYGIAKSPDKPSVDKVPALAKAAEYLVAVQQPNGAIALPMFGAENYNTSIAIMALKALNNPKYDEVLQKALDFTLSCQLDEKRGYNSKEHVAAYGAFGYSDGKKGDLSNTSFSLDALKAMGVKEDSPAYKNALIFIKRCQDAETNDSKMMDGGDNTGGFVYLPGDSEFGKVKSRNGTEVPKPYGNMTYAGIKALIYCGVKADSNELKDAWKWIKSNYSATENPGGNGSQGYYYYAVAFAKAFTASGMKELTLPDGKKVRWANDLSANLAKLQSPDGSFMNKDQHWMESDPILATACALQALNLCIEAMP
ncbi:MAG: terpene cyclase/mutase family protein [Planctomycetes bacterium]|nr:terpene cyclase/mutase family protein [Planctomycetota bacterium]